MNIKIKALILSLIVILFTSCESNDNDSTNITLGKKTCLHFNIDKGPDSPISYSNETINENTINVLYLLTYSNTNNNNTYTLKGKANITDSLANGVYNYTTTLNKDSQYKFVIIANDDLTNIKTNDNYNTLTTTSLSKTFSNNTNTSDLVTNGIPMVGQVDDGTPITLASPYSYNVSLIKAVCKLKIENNNTSSLTIENVQLMQVPSSSYVLTSDNNNSIQTVNSNLKKYIYNDSYYFLESKVSDAYYAPCVHITGTYTKATISSKAEYTIPLIKDEKPIELKRNYIYTISFTTESNRSINSATLIEQNNKQNEDAKSLSLDINN